MLLNSCTHVPFEMVDAPQIYRIEVYLAMKLAEIRRAVDEGLIVHWQSQEYEVIRSSMHPFYLVRSRATNHCIGLTWADGVTLNGKEKDFFIGDSSPT